MLAKHESHLLLMRILIDKMQPSFRIIVVLLCFAVSSCHSEDPQVWLPGHQNYVPFPVSDIVVSEDNRFVGLTVDARSKTTEPVIASALSLYMLDLKTGVHKLLGSGDSFLRLVTGRQFLYYASEESPVLLFDGLQEVRSFPIGRRRQGWWDAASQGSIFETDRPNDREGFSTIGLIDLKTGQMNSVELKEPTELLTVCGKTGRFYTESYDVNVGRNEYDPNGVFISRTMSPLAVYSANCRYVLPFAALGPHGPDDWAVFQAESGIKLMDFRWSDTDPRSYFFEQWNPRY